jgi:predicted MPP superfamily phosphohydrolase
MRSLVGGFAFLIIFILSTTLASMFVAYELAAIYGVSMMTLTHLLMGLCIGFLALLALEKHSSSIGSRALFIALSLALGVVFFAIMTAVAWWFATLLFPSLMAYGKLVFPLTVVVLFAIAVFSALWTRTRRMTVKVPGLSKRLTVVQASDVHIGAIWRGGTVKRLVHLANQERPDLVVITGDLFDGSGNPGPADVAAYKQLKAPAFAILGNHDLYLGAERAQKLLEGAGVKVLRGEQVALKGIRLAGIDSPLMGKGDDPAPGLRAFKGKEPLVLLYHMPLGLKDAKAAGAVLLLTGHTHAGQLFPFSIFIRSFFKHTYGHYVVDGLHLNVSSGFSTWGPPLRFGTRPEIVVITLVPAKRSS